MDAKQPIKYPHDHCRNYLPHIENKQYQMITFRLNDSVPRHVVEQWKETLNHLTGSQVGPQVSVPAAAGQQVSAPAATGSQVSELAKNTDSQVSNFATTNSPFRTHQQEIHRLLKLIDQYEDAGIGECLLRDDSIAQIVQDTLLFNHQKKYELICWCIMPNHVHTLIAPVEGMSLSEIMYDWKSYTTHTINKALNRKGKLWMMEYFDRYIRDNDHSKRWSITSTTILSKQDLLPTHLIGVGAVQVRSSVVCRSPCPRKQPSLRQPASRSPCLRHPLARRSLRLRQQPHLCQ